MKILQKCKKIFELQQNEILIANSTSLVWDFSCFTNTIHLINGDLQMNFFSISTCFERYSMQAQNQIAWHTVSAVIFLLRVLEYFI